MTTTAPVKPEQRRQTTLLASLDTRPAVSRTSGAARSVSSHRERGRALGPTGAGKTTTLGSWRRLSVVNSNDTAERRRRLVDVAASHAETVLTAIRECAPPAPGTLHLDWLLAGLRAEMERLAARLRIHLPIAVDEHGQVHPAGDAIARLLAELLYLVTRYGWLYELPPVLAAAFTEDLARLSTAAHQTRDVAGRPML